VVRAEEPASAVGYLRGKANEGGDIRRFAAEKAWFLAQNQHKTGQNPSALFTDRLMG
jgi:hypothetical protein